MVFTLAEITNSELPVKLTGSRVKDLFSGEGSVQKEYSQSMEYLEIQNTGENTLVVTVNGMDITIEPGEGFGEEFSPFKVISFAGDTTYKGFVKNRDAVPSTPPIEIRPEISDTFSGATFGTTDTGQTYTYDGDLASPLWSVEGGKAHVTNADGVKLTSALIDAGSVNVFIKSDITMNGGAANYPGLVLNYVDTNNQLLLRGDATSGMKLLRKASGAWSTLASFPLTITTGTTYTVEATLNNKQIEVKVNNAVIGTYTITDTQYAPVQTGTKFGIAVKDSASSHDNLVIKPL
jgi:hypothetical protein